MVPVNAVRRGTKGDFVWVLKADKSVTMRTVTRGEATIEKVQIASGLQAGEQVITEGADRLKEGAKVTLPGGGARRGGAGAGTGAAAGAPVAAAPVTGMRHAGAPAAAPEVTPAATPAAATPAAAPPAERRHRKEQGAAQ